MLLHYVSYIKRHIIPIINANRWSFLTINNTFSMYLEGKNDTPSSIQFHFVFWTPCRIFFTVRKSSLDKKWNWPSNAYDIINFQIPNVKNVIISEKSWKYFHNSLLHGWYLMLWHFFQISLMPIKWSNQNWNHE